MISPEKLVLRILEKFINEDIRLTRENNIGFFDFKSSELSGNHFLPDGDHLNRSGTAVATAYFKKKGPLFGLSK